MNALAKTDNTDIEIPSDVSMGAMEMAIGAGDFSRFSPGDKLRFLNLTCQSLKLNPLTLPIRIIKMDGREVMYATAECSAQLAYRDKISVKKIEEKSEHDCYIVRVSASSPDGRTHEDIGVVEMLYPEKTVEWRNGQKVYVPHPMAGKPFTGKDWANAVMKCHTRASRRAILRICSLGLPDESEVEEMPRARVSAVASVDSAIEESASSRAAMLNAAKEEPKPIDVSISQEPPISTGVQPPVAATAPAQLVADAAPVVGETNIPQPPDDFSFEEAEPVKPPAEAPETQKQKTIKELETLFGANKDCVGYLVRRNMLAKGAKLETIDDKFAAKIIKPENGFMRAVEQWVKGGRK